MGEPDPNKLGGQDISVEYGPMMPRLLHGIPPINIEAWSHAPFFMLGPAAYSEDFLLRDLKNMTIAGEGIDKHSPEVRKVVAESLKHAPDLLDEYMNSAPDYLRETYGLDKMGPLDARPGVAEKGYMESAPDHLREYMGLDKRPDALNEYMASAPRDLQDYAGIDRPDEGGM